MALPVTIPNTFANATSSIPLSQLDANFSTLANAVNGINSGAETLANLKASNVTITGGTISNVTLDNVTVQTESFDNVTMSNVTITSGNATFTNVTCTLITNGAGTSAAPSITTAGDPNTGIFFPAADTIAFAEGGAEAMRIDSSGNVGIGITTPATMVEMSRNSGLSTGTGTTTALRLSDTGADAGANTWNTTQQFTALQFYSADTSGVGATVRASVGATMETTNAASSALTFFTNSSGTPAERMRIDSSGNVGLSTVNGNSNFGKGNGYGGNTTATASGYLDPYNAATGNTLLYNTGAFPILFGTNNTERARITSGGYFKASNAGTYANSTGAYHELRQTGNSGAVFISATNTSFSDVVLQAFATRNTTNNSYYLITAGVENVATRFAVADSGAIATAGGIALGTPTPATSGIGVQFPATQSASSDANTLDDYEEGTYVVTFTPATSGTITLNSSINELSYIKIGKQVTIFGRVSISSVSSPVGPIQINLPFTPEGGLVDQSDFYAFSVFTHDVNLDGGTISLFGEIAAGTSYAVIQQMFDNANWIALPAANLKGNNNEYFFITGSYIASS